MGTTTTSPSKRGGPARAKPHPARWTGPPPLWLLILLTAGAAALAVAWVWGGLLSTTTTTSGRPSAAATAATHPDAPPAACDAPSPSPSTLLPPPSDACWPAGEGCPASQLEAANSGLAPILAALVRTPFFRYFKVSLTCGCPFWREEDGMCALQDCAVCECPDTDVPPAFTAAEAVEGGPPAVHGSCRRLGRLEEVEGDPSAKSDAAAVAVAAAATAAAEPDVDRWVDADVRARLVSVRGWRGIDNPWMDGGGGGEGAPPLSSPPSSPSSDREYTYIDLTKNPERYTGYTGPSARRVWDFIYSQACFAGVGPESDGSDNSASTCGDAPARTTFFRIMSGVHASITTHIAADYLMDESARRWGPNLALYAERLGGPAHAWRRSNLRFAHAFVARAVAVAGPLLEAADYRVGGSGGNGGAGGGGDDGGEAAALVRSLLASPGLAAVCGAPWDGARALVPAAAGGGGGTAADPVALTAGMQAAFRNVTAVMDCVGCEKCRLWGKLQLLGVATALKVLVADSSSSAEDTARRPLTLERNEAVALVNLFDRLARSVGFVAKFEAQLAALEAAGLEPEGPVVVGSGSGSGGGNDLRAAAFGF